ncbi:phosphotransferase [Clostridium sp. WILCCON 0269]|uniref:Phosphotransferase n=1 Tax=Candidatus Clostridium eludens TaxID=3381663 RepID=A0ABW8SF99_9CLOT
MDNMLEETLELYDMQNAQVKFIRFSENLIFKVIYNNMSYVARIHKYGEGIDFSIFGDDMHSIKLLEAEMKILNIFRNELSFYISSDNRSMVKYCDVIQKPISNKYGKFVSMLSNGVPVTMLSWINGIDFGQENIGDVDLFNIGVLVGRMHIISRNRLKNLKLYRKSYDASMVEKLLYYMHKGLENSSYSDEQYKSMEEAAREVQLRMKELDLAGNSYGIIHSDLTRTNLVKNNNCIVPIDFCLSAYGYYYHDLGTLFLDFYEEEQQKFIIQGYESITREKINYRYIETFEVYQTLLYLAANASNFPDISWLPNKIFKQ